MTKQLEARILPPEDNSGLVVSVARDPRDFATIIAFKIPDTALIASHDKDALMRWCSEQLMVVISQLRGL